MKIIRDKTSQIYKERNRLLGNCITIIDDNNEYHYEFCIKGNEALIITDDIKYIEDAVNEFRSSNLYISKFYTEDRNFYQQFDEVFTFKLPIKVIQPSQFFIDKELLEIIENNMHPDMIYIPVAIINDEYVALDGHTRLYALLQNYEKLVNVYISDYKSHIPDFVYICKEQNILNVSSMPVLSHEEFEKYWVAFVNDYFQN